jgi:hypothetical protein
MVRRQERLVSPTIGWSTLVISEALRDSGAAHRS